GYRDGLRVALEGVGRYERNPKRLKVIESVERVSFLDELDVSARIDELRLLKDGWLDGMGRAPSPAGLDWLAASFQRGFYGDLALRYVYPTEDGGVRLEWELGSLDRSVDVDLESKSGALHSLDRETDEERTQVLDLDGEGWATLRAVVGGAETERN